MYSVILMAAMSTGGAETPAFGGKFAAHRSHFACHGCFGGCHGFRFSCHGCYGACFGCHGGYLACHGCFGGSACYGGCYGGCYGSCIGGCHGCYGGCYGVSNYFLDHSGFVSPMGGYGTMGPMAPMTAPGNNPMVAPPEKPEPSPKSGDRDPLGGTTSRNFAPARLTLDVPSDAKVFVDDTPYSIPAGTRQFQTPPLKAGQTYFYTVRIEGERDGRPYNETRRVLVRAGDDLREAFLGIPVNDNGIKTVKAE